MKFYKNEQQLKDFYVAASSMRKCSRFCHELKEKTENILKYTEYYKSEHPEFMARKDIQFILSRNYSIDFVDLCTLALAENYIFNTHDRNLNLPQLLNDALMFILRPSHQRAFAKLVKEVPQLKPLLDCVNTALIDNPQFIESARMTMMALERNRSYAYLTRNLSLFKIAKAEVSEKPISKLSDLISITELAIVCQRPWERIASISNDEIPCSLRH